MPPQKSHRLDRETSGVMMFAKSEELANRIRDEWNSITEKRYMPEGWMPEGAAALPPLRGASVQKSDEWQVIPMGVG